VAALLACLGCSAERYDRRAERSADELLAPRELSTLGRREADVQRPRELPPAPPSEAGDLDVPTAVPAEGSEEEEPLRVLDLRGALAQAFETNRDMITRKETLHLQALSLAGVRHGYSPQLALTLAYVFDEVPGSPENQGGSASFSASQILPTGAELSLDAGTNVDAVEGRAGAYDSLVSLQLVQPLLRGGGHAVAYESLIQGERSLVYAIRDFELFREDFAISVAQNYYDLVNRKQSIENQRRNMESNEFARRKAEALFAVSRVNELEVLRARRSELTARNDMLEAEEGLKQAQDQFRIFLGLPDDVRVDVQPDAPPFTPVHYDVDSALAVAMENRLDLLTRRQQLEDVERGVALSKNALLPDLSLAFSTAYATAETDRLGGQEFERTGSSVSVSLGLPIDRVRESNAYRSSLIGLAQARRELELFEDQLAISITSSFRELDRRLESLDIQRQLIVDQTKNLRIAELLFERGENQNRDVVEANQSLLDAQNALIDEQVSYEIARLRLMRDLGLLFVDETGMWK